MSNTILVSRFSALGDVAISVHVLTAFLEQNPDTEIILLTKPPFKQLFKNIKKIKTFDVDLKNKHKSIKGLKKLCQEITSEYKIDFYADLHNVLRTKLISFFLPNNIKKTKIDKGRREKKQLTRRKNKKLQQLKHSAERYADVFRKLGFKLDLTIPTKKTIFAPSKNIAHILSLQSPKIGIAPFAKHHSKTYPIDRIEKIIAELNKKHTILLFGGGKTEKEITEKLETKYQNVNSIIGKFSMSDEISLLNNCKAVLTMDSGNMHLASLTNTKIISIWGATHPFLGFSAFNKQNSTFIQKDINCRPCSVFGNKKCYKRTYECMDINENMIIEAILTAIK
ncbi:MAG: glycosyltransferase family 9 protein [Bacteroidales bacterium]|nr:glycosyltransferase family 9 protein [Bacteroidales bacterium]